MKLSIIIGNRNDIVMFNVTLNNILESLKSTNYDCEVVVVENSNEECHKLINQTFPAFIAHSGIRFLRQEEPCFTEARMKAAREAKGEYLFCIDSHVLIGNNTLNKSIEFMESNKSKSIGFGHPPMRWSKDGVGQLRQAMGMAKDGTLYARVLHIGKSKNDCKIFWGFMPWICKREWYLNTLKGYGSHAKHRLSWGGAELLQQLKSWMLGYENWYIHTDPVIHIGPFNRAVYATGQAVRHPYKDSGNYPEGFGVLLALMVLAGEEEGYRQAKMAKVRLRRLHKINVDELWPKAVELGKEEHMWLMKNKKISFTELLNQQPWNK